MECVEGGQLKALIEERQKTQRGFTEEEASAIIRGIASALEYIHTKDTVHRDLKPGIVLYSDDSYPCTIENILFADQADLSTIKIVDFGLSVQYEALEYTQNPNRALWYQGLHGTGGADWRRVQQGQAY